MEHQAVDTINLIQRVTLNLHEELQKILHNPSARNGQLNVVRKSLEPYFEEAWAKLIELLGIVNWIIEKGSVSLISL